jgi:UDP-glucose:(heptosyl)LPS alpha-1,3-glucosyltransferase
MAGGLPVMISSRVGAKDLVREGENGFVIDRSSDYPYTASRLKLLLDESIRRKMSVAAFETAAQNTWDRVAAKYSDLYREILEAKRD